jgi:hypothetical protein
MWIHQEELLHPTQAGRVRLNVFEIGSLKSSVYGMEAPGGAHYLVTEDRVGTSTVVSTLGTFLTREEALRRAQGRSEELKSQHWLPARSA